MKDSEPPKEGARTEKSGAFIKQRASVTDAAQLKRPTSSVDADIVGPSPFNSQSQPKQEASTATSKSYTFKEGKLTATVICHVSIFYYTFILYSMSAYVYVFRFLCQFLF